MVGIDKTRVGGTVFAFHGRNCLPTKNLKAEYLEFCYIHGNETSPSSCSYLLPTCITIYVLLEARIFKKTLPSNSGGHNSGMNLTVQKQSNLKIHVALLALAML